MLVTMIIIASLLAGAVVLVSMQLSSSRSTDLSRSTTAAMYCAEAGVQAARVAVGMAQIADVESAIATSAGSGSNALDEPAWLTTAIDAAGSHDVNGDGAGPDFKVYLKDNDDEVVTSGSASVLSDDIDYKVWIVSTCLLYPETPQVVSELVEIPQVNGKMYDWQAGGAFGNNNYNFMQVTQ